MIVSIYQDSDQTLTRLANAVMDGDRNATFVADRDWEITHYGMMEKANSAAMLAPLPGPVIVRTGDSISLNLKEVNISFSSFSSVVWTKNSHLWTGE